MSLAANALTTLADAKDELNITDSDQDLRLERMINVASTACQTFIGYELQKVARTQKYRPPNGPRLVLDNVPLVSIASIANDGSTVEASTYSIEDAAAGIVFCEGGWSGRDFSVPRSIAGDIMTGTGKLTLSVTYTAGYVLPGDVGTRDLPQDIEEACLLTVVSLFRSRGRDRAVSSKSTGDASVSYRLPNSIIGVGAGGIIPDEAVVLLMPHRRLAL